MAAVTRLKLTGRSRALALLAVCAGVAASAQDAARVYPLTLTTGSRLVIEAKINGRPVSALLDSAAEATFLDRGFAHALGLKGGEAVAGQGSGQAAFETTLVSGVTLEAVGLSLTDQTVGVTDLGDVGRRLLGHPIDVILGREIFDAARLAIDIDGHSIAVVTRAHEPRGVRLELVTEHGIETVPASVAGSAPVRATFDLGNGSQVLISRALAERLKLLGAGNAVRTERGGGLGGETERQLLTLEYLELAGRRFTGIEAAVDPQPSASDLNVGVSVLRHFRITTDYAQHAVWLEPRD